MLDGMPPEVKANYYIKRIDAANVKRFGEDHPTIAGDPATKTAVNDKLVNFLTKDEGLRAEIADQQSILDKVKDPETRGDVSAQDDKTGYQDA